MSCDADDDLLLRWDRGEVLGVVKMSFASVDAINYPHMSEQVWT